MSKKEIEETKEYLRKYQPDPDTTKGLYKKYHVERLNDATGKHKDCMFYVLDLNHDKFSISALKAYAKACRNEYPQLSFDIQDLIADMKRSKR